MPPCHLSTTHPWCSSLPADITAGGKHYCPFHAPAEHKGMTEKAFNAMVMRRVDVVRAEMVIAPGREHVVDLSGTVFPHAFDFSFQHAIRVLPGLNLAGAVFHGQADLNALSIGGPVNFTGAVFHDVALFMNTEFRQDATFSGAVFHGPAVFISSAFQTRTDLKSAVFHDDLDTWETFFAHPDDHIE